jgi:hypothetical protein
MGVAQNYFSKTGEPTLCIGTTSTFLRKYFVMTNIGSRVIGLIGWTSLECIYQECEEG